jgi:DNA-3-methyladenine glycosylase
MSEPLPGSFLAALRPVERGFYQRDTRTVARELLGKLLLRRLPDGEVAVRLTEVEAYLGVTDAAAHTYRGRRTPRVASMWGDGGHLYVYFTYGMHHCANVVTGAAGIPEAVLLRGAIAVAGRDLAVRGRGRDTGPALLDGPARLCQGLVVDRHLDGADLTGGGAVVVLDDGLRLPDAAVRRLPRVGVAYAGEAAAWPLRFLADLGAPWPVGAAGPPGGVAHRAAAAP